MLDSGIFGRNLEIFRPVWVFPVLREENRNPTRQNRFLVMKTRRRSAKVVRLAGFKSDPVSSLGGSGTRMNLDSPRSNIESKFLHCKYFEGISISLNVITDKLK